MIKKYYGELNYMIYYHCRIYKNAITSYFFNILFYFLQIRQHSNVLNVVMSVCSFCSYLRKSPPSNGPLSYHCSWSHFDFKLTDLIFHLTVGSLP